MTKESPEPTYYEQLVSIDIITPVLEVWSQGKISCDMDTRKFKLHREIGINRPWTFAAICQDRKCLKWLGIYHKFYNILAPPCKQCWKVVYAPLSLSELFDMQEFQAELNLPAKCGTEQRDYTSGLGSYRAFWYAPFYAGLKGGRAYFQRIKSALIKTFGEDLILTRQKENRFFLKRGCTELERDFGPSENWDKIDHSAKFNLLESVWEDPTEMEKEWSPMVYTNRRRWIELAVAYDDKSVLNYVKGPILGIPSVKYHESKHKEDKFPLYVNKDELEPKKDLFEFERKEKLS